MPEPTTLLLLGLAAAGGAYLLLKDSDAMAAQPTFDPAALGECTDVKDGVRSFKPDVAAKIKVLLGTKGVKPVEVTGAVPPGVLLEVTDASQGQVNALGTVNDALALGLVVLATVNLCMPNDKSPKLILIVTKDKRSTASEASKFAVLAEQTSATIGAPVPQAPPFDPGMPADVVEMVNAALSDPNITPEALDKMAEELEREGFPIAAKALRDRAKSIRLKRKMQDDRAGGTPFTIRATAEGNAADLPSSVAKFYTGDQGRWREIVPVNSQLGMIIKDSQWGPIPDPWKAGLTILLPLSWEARGKGLPPASKEKKSKKNGVAVAGPPNPDDPSWNKPL